MALPPLFNELMGRALKNAPPLGPAGPPPAYSETDEEAEWARQHPATAVDVPGSGQVPWSGTKRRSGGAGLAGLPDHFGTGRGTGDISWKQAQPKLPDDGAAGVGDTSWKAMGDGALGGPMDNGMGTSWQPPPLLTGSDDGVVQENLRTLLNAGVPELEAIKMAYGQGRTRGSGLGRIPSQMLQKKMRGGGRIVTR